MCRHCFECKLKEMCKSSGGHEGTTTRLCFTKGPVTSGSVPGKAETRQMSVARQPQLSGSRGKWTKHTGWRNSPSLLTACGFRQHMNPKVVRWTFAPLLTCLQSTRTCGTLRLVVMIAGITTLSPQTLQSPEAIVSTGVVATQTDMSRDVVCLNRLCMETAMAREDLRCSHMYCTNRYHFPS